MSLDRSNALEASVIGVEAFPRSIGDIKSAVARVTSAGVAGVVVAAKALAADLAGGAGFGGGVAVGVAGVAVGVSHFAFLKKSNGAINPRLQANYLLTANTMHSRPEPIPRTNV